jgi:hypothetical protein
MDLWNQLLVMFKNTDIIKWIPKWDTEKISNKQTNNLHTDEHKDLAVRQVWLLLDHWTLGLQNYKELPDFSHWRSIHRLSYSHTPLITKRSSTVAESREQNLN